MEASETPVGLTRRELLRRGSALGGAVVFAVPAVQVMNMAAAGAGASTGSSSYGQSGGTSSGNEKKPKKP